jgi:ribosomal-protein-serine acetyltransferase
MLTTLPGRIALDRDLELHPLTTRYAEPLFRLIQQDRAHLRQWQNWPDRIRTIDHMRQVVRRTYYKIANGDGFDLVIMHRGMPAGKIGLVYINRPQRFTEIGYWLGESFQGQGLVTRACRFVVHFAMTDLDLCRVQVRCAEDNGRSRAIPQRLGFRNAGRLPFRTNIHGEPHYEQLYIMQAEDWRSRMFYHITTREAWQTAWNYYRADSLETQGFIHLSANEDQVLRVANALYAGQRDLIVLCIDPTLVRSPIKQEPPDTTVPAEHYDGELFPHLYGALPVAAVLQTVDLLSEADGGFRLAKPLA